MAYQTIYEYSGSLYGRSIDIEIQEDSASTLTEDTIDVLSLKRRVGGDSDNIDNPIIGQIFSAKIIDQNYTNNGSIYDKIRDKTDLRVRISIDSEVWRGYVVLDSFRRPIDPQYSTYEIELKFVDGLYLLKSKNIDIQTAPLFYRDIQEYLDDIGFAFDTVWVTDYKDLLSSDSLIESYDLDARDMTHFDFVKNVLSILNCQISQYDGRWFIIQRDISTNFPISSLVQYPSVSTNTYSITNVFIRNVIKPESLSDSSIRDNAIINIIPAIASIKINLDYNILDTARSQDQIKEDLGVRISSFRENNTTFAKWTQTGSPVYSSTNAVLQSGDSLNTEWFGVINIDKYSDDKLYVDIRAYVTGEKDDNSGTTYGLDWAEIKYIGEDGTFWLREDMTWQSTQIKFNFSYTAGTSTQFLQFSHDGAINYPDAGTGYIDVSLFYQLDQFDTGQFSDLTIEPVVIRPNIDLKSIVIAQAVNESGSKSNSLDFNIRNNNVNLTGIYAESRSILALEYKDPYYKLPDITALKKSSQQSIPLKKIRVTLDQSYTIFPATTYLYDSDEYRILAVDEDVFENTATFTLVEYNYDESLVTLNRGIYS